MEWRRMGRTGLQVSPLSLGTGRFLSASDRETSERLVNRFLEAGFNWIDTANVYASGQSEEIVGRAVRGRREEVVITTKVRGRMWAGAKGMGLSRAHIMRACEDSLRRLDTDYIDLYLCHAPDPTTPIDETVSALNDLVRQGKVRYTGASNHPAWQTMKGIGASDRWGWARFDCVQEEYNLVQRGIEREVAPLCGEECVGVTAYSPLAVGFLTGKYRRAQPIPPDSYAAKTPDYAESMLTERNFQVLEVVLRVAEELGASPGNVAIAWLLSRPYLTAAIIGAASMEQLEENLKAVEVKLSPEQIQALDEASSPREQH